uniref:Mating-type protein MAT-1 n=1 Tax=Neocamarosporium betae TaxID=1979465 RepID=A0A481XVC0_NEOBT|nr:MAT1-1 [Neocamarosporium betae]
MSHAALAMAIPRDPTNAEIARFLSTRSGAQMLQLMRSLREPAAQAALTAAMLLMPPPPPVSGRSTTSDKNKKALNAFVGFRCYYINIPTLKQWPMKKLSHLMGLLWEADPNKSLWSLMAKAWSAIRDQVGKDQAPLDGFFSIICPQLQMPSPETYLESHGWTPTIDKDGGPTVSRDNDFQVASVSAGNLSVEDIIAYVQAMGYAQDYRPITNTTSATFLGYSVKLPTDKNNQESVAAQTAGSVFEGRALVRNKRRVKRQSARDTGILYKLKSDIAIAHGANPADYDFGTAPVPTNPFYDDVTSLFPAHVAHPQEDVSLPGDMANSLEMSDGNLSTFADHTAFLPGADEYATLPTWSPGEDL